MLLKSRIRLFPSPLKRYTMSSVFFFLLRLHAGYMSSYFRSCRIFRIFFLTLSKQFIRTPEHQNIAPYSTASFTIPCMAGSTPSSPTITSIHGFVFEYNIDMPAMMTSGMHATISAALAADFGSAPLIPALARGKNAIEMPKYATVHPTSVHTIDGSSWAKEK